MSWRLLLALKSRRSGMEAPCIEIKEKWGGGLVPSPGVKIEAKAGGGDGLPPVVRIEWNEGSLLLLGRN